MRLAVIERNPVPEVTLKTLDYWKTRFVKMREQGFFPRAIAEEYGWLEEDVKLVLAGKVPAEYRVKNIEARKAGQRLLYSPSTRVINYTFGGDREAYQRCVLSNFGDVME